MSGKVTPARVDRDGLRAKIQAKYEDVANHPETGFHFHTGLPLARMLGYPAEQISSLPVDTVASFAGTGNPFAVGELKSGEQVLDIGCGAGFDTLIAASYVAPTGHVFAIDMTEAMVAKTEEAVMRVGVGNVTVRHGYAESLPVEDASMDVVISNGVLNLTPDKEAVLREIWRVLKPGGRMQIADIVVHKEVDQSAKDDIELWSG